MNSTDDGKIINYEKYEKWNQGLFVYLCKNSLNRYIGNTYNKLRNKLIYLSFVKYPLVFLFNFVILRENLWNFVLYFLHLLLLTYLCDFVKKKVIYIFKNI